MSTTTTISLFFPSLSRSHGRQCRRLAGSSSSKFTSSRLASVATLDLGAATSATSEQRRRRPRSSGDGGLPSSSSGRPRSSGDGGLLSSSSGGLGNLLKIVKEKQSKKIESIGAFQKLPIVMPSIDILGSALRKARRISPTKGIANIAKREKNKGAKQLDALMKELAVPLRTYVENFPDKAYLHPYERSLIELTLGDGYYEKVLGKVDALRKRVVSVGKEHASLCAKSTSKREAEERLNEGLKKIEEIFAREQKVVDDLLGIAKTLRAMPVINLETPTLCLVGAPNVGKSSLVHVLSTGKPEVCNYPFTTRGILMGHIILNYQKFQVTDTPGLLKRHDEDRNNLEKLTLAVLSHLPTAVLYVHDLSGECGTSPSDQFAIYKEIRERFSGHLWLDVVSKFDLLKTSSVVYATEEPCPTQQEVEKYRKSGPDGAINVSVKTLEGLHELKHRVQELLSLQKAKIEDTTNNHEK